MLSASKPKQGEKEELGYTCKIPLSKLINLSKLANHLRSIEEEVGIKHQFYSQETLSIQKDETYGKEVPPLSATYKEPDTGPVGQQSTYGTIYHDPGTCQ